MGKIEWLSFFLNHDMREVPAIKKLVSRRNHRTSPYRHSLISQHKIITNVFAFCPKRAPA